MRKFANKFFYTIFFLLFFSVSFASQSSGTILSSTYSTALVCQDSACSPTLGHRINFKPTAGPSNPAITIDDSNGVDGYAWGEKFGWINFSVGNSGTTTSGVQVNTQTGELYGYAWSQNAGWINFSPTNYGVSINGNGEFTGYAWAAGTDGGWIKFDCSLSATTTCVKTDWVPTGSRSTVVAPTGGGGGGGGSSIVDPYSSVVATSTPINNFYLVQTGKQHQPTDFSNDFRADINDSGRIDLLDFNILLVNWGKSAIVDTKKSKKDRCPDVNKADVNCDGKVDILDFNLVLVYWNTYVGDEGIKLKQRIGIN